MRATLRMLLINGWLREALLSSVRFADSFPRRGSMRCNRRITHKNNQQDTESEHIDYTVTKIPKRFT